MHAAFLPWSVFASARRVLVAVGLVLAFGPDGHAQTFPLTYPFGKGEELEDSLWVGTAWEDSLRSYLMHRPVAADSGSNSEADPDPNRKAPRGHQSAPPAATTLAEQVEAAVQHYRTGGSAPVLHTSDAVVYPFGQTQAVLVCAVFRVCAVAFEAGEQPATVVLGDTDRWETYQTQERDTPVLIIKPLAPNVETNLIVPTDRRTYHLTLVSSPVPGPDVTENPRVRYMRQVAFYYPEDVVHAWAQPVEPRADAGSLLPEEAPYTLSLDALAYPYRCETGAFPCTKAGFPITIEQAFTAEGRTFLVVGEDARHEAAPILYRETLDGERQLVNYNLRGRYYVVQGTPDVLHVVYGLRQKRRFLGRGRGLKEVSLRLTRAR